MCPQQGLCTNSNHLACWPGGAARTLLGLCVRAVPIGASHAFPAHMANADPYLALYTCRPSSDFGVVDVMQCDNVVPGTPMPVIPCPPSPPEVPVLPAGRTLDKTNYKKFVVKSTQKVAHVQAASTVRMCLTMLFPDQEASLH